uniref:Serine protease family S54 putative n=1 Tax=Albugo laibachii Nc14 TaxID=890382 RepID=F0W223_9STRA|nr:serine protease family S54 putative [Albugo laibachii Nc14]|eukprot:CCA15102.1 serine protease family S54 putative [Albugo laibachii Nc14]
MRPGSRSRHGQRDKRNLLVLYMLIQKIMQMDRKPPLTISLIVLMSNLHFRIFDIGATLSPESYMLCPNLIVRRHEWERLIGSAFFHGDDIHLYHNMVSFLWKGYQLESKMGSYHFACLLIYLLLVSHGLIVLASYLIFKLQHNPHAWTQCSLGFSAVLFGLKVVLNSKSPNTSNIYGFQVPTKYAAWLELVLIHVLVPDASFLGHLCGIVAGYSWISHAAIGKKGETLYHKWISFIRSARHTPINGRPSGKLSQNQYAEDEKMARRLQEEEAAAEREAVRRRRLDRLSNVQTRLS